MPLILLAVWAICLIAYAIVQPRLWSAGFWLLAVPAFATGGGYMLSAHMDSRRTRRDAREWMRKLQSSVDVLDVADDGHVHEWFDPEEWEKIFQELERMPKGQRSLRRAIEIVDPEFAKNSG